MIEVSTKHKMKSTTKKWPHWDLQERTKKEISQIFGDSLKKSSKEPWQEVEWFMSLLPCQIEKDAPDGSEWESEDENEDMFPESLSSVKFAANGFQETKIKNFLGEETLPSAKTMVEQKLEGALKSRECVDSISIAEIESTSAQESTNVKASLRIFVDEKRDSEKKKEELVALKRVSDSELILLMNEATQTITCDEKKAAFCVLFTEVVKEKSFLLGEHFFLPWFQNSGTNFGIPVATLSQMINLFCENACEDVLLPLLGSSTSCLLNDLDLLKDILSLADSKYWLLLLRKFLIIISDLKLAEWHVPVLHLLCSQVDAMCDPSFDETLINNLLNLLLANAVDFSADRHFGNIILILITAVQKHKTNLNFMSVSTTLSSIVQFYKGPLRFKARQLLKKLTAQ